MSGDLYTRYRLKSSTWAAVRGFGWIIAPAFLTAEFLEYAVSQLGEFRVGIFLGIVGVGLVAAVARFVKRWRKLAFYEYKDGCSARIDVVVGDLFETVEAYKRASFVVGVNDQLIVTGLDNESAHWDYLERYWPDATEVERQDLTDDAVKKCLKSWTRKDPREALPIGTVVVVETLVEGETRDAYHFVNSSRGEHSFTEHDSAAVNLAQLWEYREKHRVRGGCMVFPLLGTGASKSSSKTYAAALIIESYFKHLAQLKVGEPKDKLVLSVNHQAVADGQVDLEAVHKYVEAAGAVFTAAQT